jgi:hypothetical protein
VQSLWPLRYFDVRAERERLLEVLAQERVIDHDREIFPACQRGDRGDVRDDHRGIRRRLDVNHFRAGLDRCLNFRDVGRIDVAEFEAEFDQQLRGDAEHSPVNGLREDNVVAGAEQAEHGVDARHARRKDVGRSAAFELRQRALECFAVRMAGARVVVALALAHFLDHVGRGLVDRGDDRAGQLVRLLAYVNGVGGKTHGDASSNFRGNPRAPVAAGADSRFQFANMAVRLG